jgi:hypothetical protein
MTGRLKWLLFIGTAFLTTALANWTDTSTGVDLNKLPHPTLVKIRSGWLKQGGRTTFDGISATASGNEREVRLRGAGKSGKHWEARLCCLDEVWRADLDGNGTQDYILISDGPLFNGRMTPLFSISILLMDGDGLPVPFFTTLYHGESGKGVKSLVDLDRNGRAELLISTYDEGVSDPRVDAFCSGYWVTQLYGFRDLRVQEIRGTIGGIAFPLVHAWTYRGSECQALETPMLHAQAPPFYEHGTARDGDVSTVVRGGSGMQVRIKPVAGCRTIDPLIVVYDRANLREIAFLNLWSSAQDDLVEAIRRDGAAVTLSGLDKWMGHGDCSANLMWARGQN